MTKKLRRRNQKTTGYQTPETLNTHEEGRNNKIWLSRLSIREQSQHSIGERQGHQERTALVEKKIVAGSHHHYLQTTEKSSAMQVQRTSLSERNSSTRTSHYS